MQRIIAGRTLVVVGAVLVLAALVPFLLALVLGAFTAGSTGNAWFGVLALVALAGPLALAWFGVAVALSATGLVLGGYRVPAIVPIAVGALAALGIVVWLVM